MRLMGRPVAAPRQRRSDFTSLYRDVAALWSVHPRLGGTVAPDGRHDVRSRVPALRAAGSAALGKPGERERDPLPVLQEGDVGRRDRVFRPSAARTGRCLVDLGQQLAFLDRLAFRDVDLRHLAGLG